MHEPVRPGPKPPDVPRRRFRRGRRYPRAITWLGFRSFWGHLWHLAASVVATEDIDARDWMEPQKSDALTERVAAILGAAAAQGSLGERLERDVWIDFVADTGDDAELSEAVADLMFRDYRVPDGPAGGAGADIVAPRGDMLVFGGDTAYPVATDLEIHNRVVVPFNRVLRGRQDGKRRVLLGIPGNHDWYCALDGFARMFRARRGKVDVAEPGDPAMAEEHQVIGGGQIGHLLDWVEAFRVGRHVSKRRTLPLYGYTPVQRASYFALQLAPGLDLWGVDRQLRTVDFSQRTFFLRERERAPERGLVLVLADPVYAMLERQRVGDETLGALELSLEGDAPLVLTGDSHHYCRQHFGRATHVIAGGGGAFLHPARIARRGLEPPAAEFPGPRASLAYALEVPFQVVRGRAGFIVHAALAALYAPAFGLIATGRSPAVDSAIVAVVIAVVCAIMAGWRKARWPAIATLAALCGAALGALPLVLRAALGPVAERLGATASGALVYLAAVLLGALGFGMFLALVTILGLEHHHGFASLSHPGYKHFLRLRVRADGGAVDGWAIGKVDPLHPKSQPVLIDRFTWRNSGVERDRGAHPSG